MEHDHKGGKFTRIQLGQHMAIFIIKTGAEAILDARKVSLIF